MGDIKSKEARSENMRAIKSRDTKPEMVIRKCLFARGYRYRISPKNIPGHPDIYLAKFNAAIFIHGCFWHRHQNCKYAYSPKSKVEFWEAKFATNIARDRIVSDQLSQDGIRQLIIWECAIKTFQRKRNPNNRLIDLVEEFLHSEIPYMELRS